MTEQERDARIKLLIESLARMDAMDEEEVDPEEYQVVLAELAKLREERT